MISRHFFAGVAVLAICGAFAQRVVTINEGFNNQTVLLNVGDTLAVRLNSNAGTGFAWSIVQNNNTLLQATGQSMSGGQNSMIGGPTSTIFTFTAAAAGGEALALNYQKELNVGPEIGGAFRVLVVISQSGGGGKTVTVTEADNGGQVTLNVSDTLIVRLSSNSSTGYSWTVGQNNSSLLARQGESQYNKGDTGLIGAPGTQVFTFKAVGSGGEALALLYQRPNTGGIQAAETFRMMVVINRSGDQPRTITLTDADNGSSINLNPGDNLVIRLSSNRTTGYSWSVGMNNPGILSTVGEPSYQAPDSTMMGAPGAQVFRFRAAGGGGENLSLLYQRPWEKSRLAAKTWTCFVTVAPN